MSIPYILLANGTIVLTTSSGPLTLTITSFNYTLVKKALETKQSEDVILSLAHEATPDGLFYVYDSQSRLIVKHIKPNFEVEYKTFNSNRQCDAIPTDSTYLGTYASYESVLQAYPEYLI